MRAYSSFLPCLMTVTSIIIGGFSAAAIDNNKNATASLNIERKVKGSSNTIQESPPIPGAYIVRLDDKTSAAKTKTTAVGTATTMQTLKQQLIANGTVQATTNDVVDVPPDRIYTESIRAFLITGIPEVMLSSLLQTPDVTSVEPDRIISINSKMKNESTKANDQPGKQGIRSMQAIAQAIPWGVTRVGGPINLNLVPNPTGRIFVLDTGISPNTNDLNIDTTMSINFVNVAGGDSPTAWGDIHGHGTHVAGTIAALNNGINVVGVVPGAFMVAVKVIDDQGNGRFSDVIAGLEYVYLKGKKGDVVNMSIGFVLKQYSTALNAAVQNTASLGIKFAIAAGNDSIDASYETPASASGANIYTVSCYDQTDTLCSFSNFGMVVDYGGPGLNILSLAPGGGVALKSGTSMSAPHIAGLLFANSIKVDGYIKGDKDANPDPIAAYAGAVIPTPAPVQNLNKFELVLQADPFSAQETSFTLTKISPGTPTLITNADIGSFKYGYIYERGVLGLSTGTYQFSLFDEAGDGLISPAYYTVTVNGNLLKTGGSFQYIDTTFFTISSPKPAAAPAPKPTAPVPKPAAPAPKPNVPVPKPSAPVPKPTVPVPKPAAPAPKPSVPVPKPAAPAPKPTVPVPKPTVPVPKPAAPAPKPNVPVPKPAAPAPKPTVPVPKPAAPAPKPTVPVPKPAAPAPKPTVPVPKPAAPAPKAKSAAPAPKPTVPLKPPVIFT
jgi:subtilisin family serine protease